MENLELEKNIIINIEIIYDVQKSLERTGNFNKK